MKFFSMSDRGSVRAENQDCAFVTQVRSKSCLAAVVCDGMGGAHGGRLASELAVSAYMAELRRTLIASSEKKPALAPIMDAACKKANAVVYGYSIANTENSGMGTTLVAVTLRGRSAEIINVGDSRAYLIEHKTIRCITRDHSVVSAMVEHGELTPEEAEHHPQKHLITRAVGVDPEVQADHFSVTLRMGSKLLLCSDGLSNTLNEQELLALCLESRHPDRICRRLISSALERGAGDNITAAVIQA